MGVGLAKVENHSKRMIIVTKDVDDVWVRYWLAPGKKAPSFSDVDGVRAIWETITYKGTAHAGWWKISDFSTIVISEDDSGRLLMTTRGCIREPVPKTDADYEPARWSQDTDWSSDI